MRRRIPEIKETSLFFEITQSAKYFLFALLVVTLCGQFFIVHRRIEAQKDAPSTKVSPIAYLQDSDGEDEQELLIAPTERIEMFFADEPVVYHIAYRP